jgi:hypothetical protein
MGALYNFELFSVNPFHYQRVAATANMDLSPLLEHQQPVTIGQKRSIGADDFRRILMGATNSSPTNVPPDPSHSALGGLLKWTLRPINNSILVENPFAPAFKLAKTQEPLHVDVDHQPPQFPFANTSPGELLRLLQLKQQQNAERQDTQTVQPTLVQPSIVLPQLALLQSALQKHQQIVAEQKKATNNLTAFVEARRAEHDTLRVLRERFHLDFDGEDSEADNELFQGNDCAHNL